MVVVDIPDLSAAEEVHPQIVGVSVNHIQLTVQERTSGTKPGFPVGG
jgi:hypothetical protein